MGERRMAGLSERRPALPCPKVLGKDGRALWRRIVVAYPEDYFRAGDLPLLQAYCQEWERYAKAQKKLTEEGEVIKGERGNVRNPWHAVLVASSNVLCQLATKLRLCANSRTTAEKASSLGEIQPANARAGLMFGDGERMQ